MTNHREGINGADGIENEVSEHVNYGRLINTTVKATDSQEVGRIYVTQLLFSNHLLSVLCCSYCGCLAERLMEHT